MYMYCDLYFTVKRLIMTKDNEFNKKYLLYLTGIVLIGEIGGQAEEKASEYLRNNNYVSH